MRVRSLLLIACVRSARGEEAAFRMRDRLDNAGIEERKQWLSQEGEKMSGGECVLAENQVTIVKVDAVSPRDAKNKSLNLKCSPNLRCRITSDSTQIDTACNTALLVHKQSGHELDYNSTRRQRTAHVFANARLPLDVWKALIKKFPKSEMPFYALPLVYIERESAQRKEMTDPDYIHQFAALHSYQKHDRYYIPYMHGGYTFHNLVPKDTPNYVFAAELALRTPKASITKLETSIRQLHPNGSDVISDIDIMPQAEIAWITSSGPGQSQRHSYVKELLKYIPIDSWGRAVNTRQDLPAWWNSGNAQKFGPIQYDIKRVLMSRYPFYLVFENSICPGYVSEKIWQALQVATIPIYLGTKDVADLVPNPEAIIQTRDFESPAALATYLKHLLTKPKLLDNLRYGWRKRNFQASFYESQANSLFTTLPKGQSFCAICRDIFDGTLRKPTTRAEPWQQCEPPQSF